MMYEKYRGNTLETQETINKNLEHENKWKISKLSLQWTIPQLQGKREDVHIVLLREHVTVVHQK